MNVSEESSELSDMLAVEPSNIVFSARVEALLELKCENYNGSWDVMIRDLERRRDSRPYLHKHVEAIKSDLKLIDALCMYESRYDVDLTEEWIAKEKDWFNPFDDSKPVYTLR